jgi:hypothetical protein
MEAVPNAWLAALIQSHLDGLALRIATEARRQMPLYRAMDPDLVHSLFLAVYQMLVQTFTSGDLGLVRTFLERIAGDRMRSGASLAGMLALTALFETDTHRLIADHADGHAEQAALAEHQLTIVTTEMRRVFAEIDRHLHRPGPIRPGS